MIVQQIHCWTGVWRKSVALKSNSVAEDVRRIVDLPSDQVRSLTEN